MGHALMDKVWLHWNNLPGNAFKILLTMAKTSMDDDLVPVYFGGWERLAMSSFGRHDWPSDNDDSAEAENIRKSTFEVVRRATNDAKKAGAIRVKRRGKRGSVAHYSLHLDAPNLWNTPELPNKKLGSNPTKGWELPNRKLGTTQQKAGVEETREPMETRGEISSSPAVPHQGPRARTAKLREIRIQKVRDRLDAANAAKAG